jgi:Ca2+-binding EF-hand superfamily protein
MKKAFVSMTLMGLLTAMGFLASAQQQEPGQQPQQQEQQQPDQGQQMSVDEVFARLDTDGDGKLSQAEFARGHAGASEQDAKALFAEVDSNGDQSISKEEFIATYGTEKE